MTEELIVPSQCLTVNTVQAGRGVKTWLTWSSHQHGSTTLTVLLTSVPGGWWWSVVSCTQSSSAFCQYYVTSKHTACSVRVGSHWWQQWGYRVTSAFLMFWFLRLEFISILRLRHHGRDFLSERLPRQCEKTKLQDWNCQPWWESWPPDSWYWIICYQINFQELNWRGLLTIISPSGKRAGSPPGLSLISRDSDILRGLLNQIHWWVVNFRE